jgi:hypothetical protein
MSYTRASHGSTTFSILEALEYQIANGVGSSPAATVAPRDSRITLGASATLLSLLAALSPTVVPSGASRRYLTLQAQTTGGYMKFGGVASATTLPMTTERFTFDLLSDDISDLRVYAASGIIVDVVESASLVKG